MSWRSGFLEKTRSAFFLLTLSGCFVIFLIFTEKNPVINQNENIQPMKNNPDDYKEKRRKEMELVLS